MGKKYKAIGAVIQLGILGCDTNKWNDKIISKNPFFCPDKSIVKLWEKYLLGIRKSGSSCGAIIEVRVRGVPVGLGAPIYSKLDKFHRPRTIYRHKLGTTVKDDELIFEEKSEAFTGGIGLSSDEKYFFINRNMVINIAHDSPF